MPTGCYVDVGDAFTVLESWSIAFHAFLKAERNHYFC